MLTFDYSVCFISVKKNYDFFSLLVFNYTHIKRDTTSIVYTYVKIDTIYYINYL